MLTRLTLLLLAAPLALAQDPAVVRHAFGKGLGNVEMPKDWKVAARQIKGKQWLVARPADADADAPTTSYVLVVMPMPKGTPADKVPLIVRQFVDRLGADAAKKPGRALTVGAGRDGAIDGHAARILPLSGTVGSTKVTGELIGRAGDQSIAVSLRLSPAAAPATATFDRIDRSLAFRIAVPALGWRAMLPASWSYEATQVDGSTAVTFAHRKLRTTRDPGAPRLLTKQLVGDVLADVSARQLAVNVMLNFQAQSKAWMQTERKTTTLAGVPATRLVLRTPDREMWIVAGKPTASTKAHLWIVTGSIQQMTAQRARLRTILASAEKLAP